MQKHPVRMTLIDELPVSLYDDGSVEIMDEHWRADHPIA